MRDIYRPGDFDLTGTAVGIVDRGEMLGPARVAPGSVLIGLESSGVHANGFSLVRQALAPLPEDGWRELISTPRGDEPLSSALLEPTRCYAGALAALRAAGVPLQAAAHVSGGGLPGNLPRIMPRGCCARVTRQSVPVQPLFATIQRCGLVALDEMWRVFNMGCGFVLVMEPEAVEAALSTLAAAGFPAFRLGMVTGATDSNGFAWAD
jgi:phosphoribosylformylglycinamidine cyclo-ligase